MLARVCLGLALTFTSAWLLAPAEASADPTVDNVSVFQRDDASRLVELSFDLAGPNASYDITISLEVSTDSGAIWNSIAIKEIWGDYPKAVPEPGRIITWNPPAEEELAAKEEELDAKVNRARITLTGEGTPDSVVVVEFPLAESASGHLRGTVLLDADGSAMVGVCVRAVEPEQCAVTVMGGKFDFSATGGLPAGEHTVVWRAVPCSPGDCSEAPVAIPTLAYNVQRQVAVRENSITASDVVMTKVPTSFASEVQIGDIRGRFFGPDGDPTYFLEAIWLKEDFTAAVTYSDPGTLDVVFKRGGTELSTFECASSPCDASAAVNMWDFPAGSGLTVVAGATSKDANFEVIPLPPINPVLGLLLHASPFGNVLSYITPSMGANGDLKKALVNSELDDMPIFDNKAFEVLSAIDFSASVDGSGQGTGVGITLDTDQSSGTPKIDVAGVKVELFAGASTLWIWDVEEDDWLTGVEFTFGAKATVTVPPGPAGLPLPPPFSIIYIRGKIAYGFSVTILATSWPGSGDGWVGNTALNPFPYGEVMLGVGYASALAIEGYFGIGGKIKHDFQTDVVTLGVFMAGGVRIILYIFTYEWPLLEWEKSLTIPPSLLATDAFGDPEIKSLDRSYLADPDYAEFLPDAPELPIDPTTCDPILIESPIQTRVFRHSSPQLELLGSDLLLVWVWDDPDRGEAVDRTKLVFSFGSEGAIPGDWSWTPPTEVMPDSLDSNSAGTGDFHPHLGILAGGKALLVWENSSSPLTDPDSPEVSSEVEAVIGELLGGLDIGVALYDDGWQDQVNFQTQDTVPSEQLDFAPLVATDPSADTAAITWISNESDDPIGTVDPVYTLHTEMYDASQAWPTGFTSLSDKIVNRPITKLATALRGSDLVVVYAADSDGSPLTLDDRELYALVNSGGTWSAEVRLTDDSDDIPAGEVEVEDANPQVFFPDATSDPVVVWYRAGDPLMAESGGLYEESLSITGGTPTAFTTPYAMSVEISEGAASGPADFSLARDSDGTMVAVWQDASPQRVDVWFSVVGVDASLIQQPWSVAQQLTCDPALETGIEPAFTAAGDLMLVYDKTQSDYARRSVPASDPKYEIHNVPEFGETDLFLLWNPLASLLKVDLDVGPTDISFDPPRLVSGSEATISATIRNIAYVPSLEGNAEFWSGAPDTGTLIGQATITAPLVFGQEQTVSTIWTVPSAPLPLEISVRLVVNENQSDRSDSNNTASVTIGIPDLLVESIRIQSAGAKRIYTVRVENQGLADAGGEDLRLERTLDNSTLTTWSLGTIVAGGYEDVTWIQDVVEPIEVSAIVDPDLSLLELDEENNTRTVQVEDTGISGACCRIDETCQDTEQSNCIVPGSSFVAGASCSDNVCDGACCQDESTCVAESSPFYCEGVYAGHNTSCAAVLCSGYTGACCRPDNSCTHTAGPLSCLALNGVYAGIGTACSESCDTDNLEAAGNLTAVVAAGDSVVLHFSVANLGSPETFVDWTVVSTPEWGEQWSFSPDSGTDLSVEDGFETVWVSFVAPQQDALYTGAIELENETNPQDTASVPISVTTSAAVPALSIWAFVALTLLLAVGGLAFERRAARLRG